MAVQETVQDIRLPQIINEPDEDFMKQQSALTIMPMAKRLDCLATEQRRHLHARDAFVVNCHLLVSFLSTFGIFDMARTYFSKESTTKPLEVLTWISLFLFPTVAYYQARSSHGDRKQYWFLVVGISVSVVLSMSLSYFDSLNFVGTSLALSPICTCGSLVCSTIYHEVTAENQPNWVSEKV